MPERKGGQFLVNLPGRKGGGANPWYRDERGGTRAMGTGLQVHTQYQEFPPSDLGAGLQVLYGAGISAARIFPDQINESKNCYFLVVYPCIRASAKKGNFLAFLIGLNTCF